MIPRAESSSPPSPSGATATALSGTRSFVRRQGRMTDAQRRALDTGRHRLVAADGGALHWPTLFGRVAPVWLEIGFGNGATLAQLADNRPEIDFLGIEVHKPGLGHLLLEVQQRQLGNVRVACADAADFIPRRLPDASLARVLLLFPDPWPKKRHHKRRLLQAPFAALLARKLVPGGVLHAATDWDEYAVHMLGVLDAQAPLRNQHGAGQFAPAPDYRIPTRFELRGRRQGNAIHDLLYERLT